MKRRDVILSSLGHGAVGMGTLAAAHPLAAQTRRAKRIGYMTALPEGHPIRVQAERELAQGMKGLGWEPGRDLLVDVRYGGSDFELHVANARDLVASGVDLILTTDNQQTSAALRATSTVPIHMAAVAPVEAGFAKSLAHPGGNATGVALVSLESQVKPVALLREILPGLNRLGLPVNSRDMATHPFWALMQDVGRRLGITIVPLPDLRDLAGLDAMLAAARQEHIQALAIGVRLFLAGAGGQRIRAWSIENKVLTWSGAWLRSDVLLAHSANLAQIRATARRQIDRILRGADPAGIPIEEPVEYDVIIHKGIARAMGLRISNSVLLQATEVLD